MKCPVCRDATLVMADRQGVEIDYCPACRGVWLDRGELDKIIERTAGEPGVSSPAAVPASARSAEPPLVLDRPLERSRRSRDDDDDDDSHPRTRQAGSPEDWRDSPRRKRRGSLLEELFDF